MKALTLTQPYATLVAIGAKQIETRSWSTTYRGPLAIHAAASYQGVGGFNNFLAIRASEPFKSTLDAHLDAHLKVFAGNKVVPPSMPRGMILCIAELVDVVPTIKIASQLSAQEIAFGNYGQGRFAWVLRNVRRLERPVSAKGKQGLWEWEQAA